MNVIIVNNAELKFENNSLSGSVARKLIKILNDAYMHSLSISCAPYTPVQGTDRAWFTAAAQLVHDNLIDFSECESVRNACIERLHA